MFWSKPNKNIENKVIEESSEVLSNEQLEVELKNLIDKRNELIVKPHFNMWDLKDYMFDETIDMKKVASCIDHDEINTSSRNNTTEKRWYFNNIERLYEFNSYRSYNMGKDRNQYIAIKYYAKDNKYFVEARIKTGVKCVESEGFTYNEDVYSTFKSEGYDDLNSLKQAVANFVEIVNLENKMDNIRKVIETNNHKKKCAELEAQAWG